MGHNRTYQKIDCENEKKQLIHCEYWPFYKFVSKIITLKWCCNAKEHKLLLD